MVGVDWQKAFTNEFNPTFCEHSAAFYQALFLYLANISSVIYVPNTCFALKVQYKEMSLLRDLLSREGITPPAFTAHDPVPPPRGALQPVLVLLAFFCSSVTCWNVSPVPTLSCCSGVTLWSWPTCRRGRAAPPAAARRGSAGGSRRVSS